MMHVIRTNHAFHQLEFLQLKTILEGKDEQYKEKNAFSGYCSLHKSNYTHRLCSYTNLFNTNVYYIFLLFAYSHIKL